MDVDIREIKNNAPKGATHYMDDDKGFDYARINTAECWLDIWCSRYSCWLPIGYIAFNESRYKPL